MIAIRSAVPDDAAGMTELVHRSAAYGGIYRPVILTQSITDDYLRANPARLAETDGKLAGFYTMLVPGRGSAGEGELDFMFVDDGVQRQGIGRLLIADLHRVAAQLGLARVHIVSHPPAEPFYRAVGAHRIGSVPPRGPVTWERPHMVLDVEPPGL